MKRAKDKQGKRQDWGSYVPDRVAGINYSWTYRDHDYAYAEYTKYTRLQADINMFKSMLNDGNESASQNGLWDRQSMAITQRLWSPIWATINFIGVRLVGWQFYKG